MARGVIAHPPTVRGAGIRPPWWLVPALFVSDRLRTSARLLALVLVLLVPGVLAIWSYAGVVDGQIGFAARERAGVTVLRPALASLAATVQGGRPDLGALTSAARASGLRIDSPLTEVDAAASAGTATPATRARLAAALAGLITAVGNDSNLILDPDLDSFYVMDAQIVQVPQTLLTAARAASPDESLPHDERVAAQAVLAGGLSNTATALASDLRTAAAHTRVHDLATRTASLDAVGQAASALASHLTSSLADPSAADATGLGTTAGAAVAPGTSALDTLLVARIDRLSADRNLRLAVAGLGLLLALWLGAAVWWRTRHDVGQVVAGMTAIASGDLSDHPLPQGVDEFAEIGRALGAARDQLIAQDQELAAASATREEYLRAGFQHQRQAERQVRERAQEIIDETAGMVTRELGDVVNQVDLVRSAASTIDERVSVAESVTNAVIHRAAETDRVATALRTSLRKVAGMAELISRIADQTKMLALNATIEAARAGDAGQGFSVVANEVKDLAMTTARSTDEIATTIDGLEGDVTALVDAIGAMSTQVAGLDEATQVLSGVASEQQSLVTRVDRAVNEALERIRSLATITDRLERREFERTLVAGAAELRAGGRSCPGQLADLSAGGVRVVPEDTQFLGLGDRVQLALTLDGQHLVLDALVAYHDPSLRPPAYGLRFVDLPGSAADLIRGQVAAQAVPTPV